jgi:hypothetical protein
MKRRDFVRSAITGAAAATVIPVAASTGKQQESYFGKNIPVKYTVDVFVAGGGPAGIAASVTAARQGQTVFIAEEQSCFGGVGTAAGLPMFCYMSDGKIFLAEGIGREVRNRLQAKNGIVPSQNKGPETDVFYKTETLKVVYDEMVIESKAQFSFCTHLIGVETKKNKIDRVICWGKSGIFSVKAKVYIDCTGDGDMAAWAGAPFEKGDEKGNMMPPTLISMWANINWKKAVDNDCGLWRQQQHLVKAINEKAVTITDKHLPGMIMTGKTTGYGNIGHTYGVDSTDEVSLTKGLIQGRKMIPEYERFYKEYLKGYEEMELVSTAAKLGIRESRRIMGDYILTADDYKNKSSFSDEIGRYSYAIDMHTRIPSTNSLEEDWSKIGIPILKPGETYGIPYRSLTPKGLDNLLVAGRCLSCDSVIIAAIRVMPGCFVTGQAAGMAASLTIEKNTTTRGISIDELRNRLKKFGAYLP